MDLALREDICQDTGGSCHLPGCSQDLKRTPGNHSLTKIIDNNIIILLLCRNICTVVRILKILAAILLLFNGVGAIYGGANLVMHPDGSSISLPFTYIEHTPFNNYFIPGIILFIGNGLFSIVALFMLLLRRRSYPLFIMAQGAILSGWILGQVILIGLVFFLQYLLGAVGLALLILGYVLYRAEKQ